MNWISYIGVRDPRGISPGLLEKVILTNRFTAMISLFSSIYFVAFFFLGQWTSFAANGICTLLLWFGLYLNSRQKFWAARWLILVSCGLILFVADLTLGPGSRVDFYYMAVAFSLFLFFEPTERKAFFLGSVMILVLWLVPNIFEINVSAYNEPLSASFVKILFYMNSVGTLVLTFYFGFVFTHSVQEYQKRLAISNKFSALGEMSAGVGHELSTPLAVIALKCELMQKNIRAGNLSMDKVETDLNIISSSAGRIGKIVRGLKNFSRSSDVDPFTNVSIQQVINDSMDMVVDKIRNAGVSVTAPEGLNLFISGRSHQISQVLINALNNSRDAIAESANPWIHIEVKKQDGNIQIRIIDSGKGIPAAVAARIMDPFFTTKEVGKGTGLGLSISKGIIEEHGGRFWLDQDSQNTCFVIEIPEFRQAPAGAQSRLLASS